MFFEGIRVDHKGIRKTWRNMVQKQERLASCQPLLAGSIIGIGNYRWLLSTERQSHSGRRRLAGRGGVNLTTLRAVGAGCVGPESIAPVFARQVYATGTEVAVIYLAVVAYCSDYILRHRRV